MSWGERSCRWFAVDGQPCKPTIENCNKDCEHYARLRLNWIVCEQNYGENNQEFEERCVKLEKEKGQPVFRANVFFGIGKVVESDDNKLAVEITEDNKP